MLSYVSPESTEELVAQNLAGEEPPTAEVIEELELFSHEREKAVADGYVTSAIVSSEAGDRYLVVREGFHTARDIAAAEFFASPDWWGELEWLSIDELVHTPVSFEAAAMAETRDER